MLSSAWQEKELPEICVVLLMFVPRAIIARVEGHISFSPPGHQSLEELVARLGLESVFAWQLPAAETKPPSTSLGSRSQSGHRSYGRSREGFALCCPCRVQCWHLTPTTVSCSLAQIRPLPHLLAIISFSGLLQVSCSRLCLLQVYLSSAQTGLPLPPWQPLLSTASQ